MKIAFVYDRVNKWGGAERVLLALHEIWPEAPLFTAVYDRKRASWADVFRVHPSFLQHVPFAKTHHEEFPWLTPMAFESFTWDGYDVVLSVTSAEAKDIITKPGTIHICYCLTPTRYLWSGEKEYVKYSGSISSFFFSIWRSTLKRWDIVASSRPDYYLAISRRVADRIKKYYRREVDKVIYPPVDLDKFRPGVDRPRADKITNDKYFLCVSRLVPYKRVDIVVDAFNRLGLPLKIIGAGKSGRSLKNHANDNIEFISHDLTDYELAAYYQKARAFVYGGEEDFGIVSLEAQACGKPVICYRKSGMAETVIEGESGEFFDEQTPGALARVIEKFDESRYDSDLCRKNAERFGIEKFKQQMKETVLTVSNL